MNSLYTNIDIFLSTAQDSSVHYIHVGWTKLPCIAAGTDAAGPKLPYAALTDIEREDVGCGANINSQWTLPTGIRSTDC